MILNFPAQVTKTNLFKLTKRRYVNIEVYSSAWNGAHIKLTVDRGDGVSHAVALPMDTTAPLTADPLDWTENWAADVPLGAGTYGFTVDTATPTSPIVVALSDASGGLARGANYNDNDL